MAALATLQAPAAAIKMNSNYNIAWEVTGNCNHNCFYCYNFWRDSLHTSDCDIPEVLDYQRITDKLISIKPMSVAITGGEPLLVFDRIKSSIEQFAANNIFVRLLTNGSLITDEIASFFAHHKVQLMVSFPTADEERFSKITKRDNFSDVVRALDILKKHNCDVLINIVVSMPNLEDMHATADFLVKRYGYKLLYFSRATKPQNASIDIIDDLLDNNAIQQFFNTCLEIKKKQKIEIRTCGGYAYCAIRNKKAYPIFAKGCGGGRSSFVVSTKGELRVCGKDSQVFGNIFEEDADIIMEKASYWKDDAAIPKECAKCRYKYSCRGGCHMSSYDMEPKFNSLDANADPEQIPKPVGRVKRLCFINPFKRYVMGDNVNYHKTDDGNRFSYMFSYVYLPDGLSSALLRGERINLFKIIFLTRFPIGRCKGLLLEMKNKKIITE